MKVVRLFTIAFFALVAPALLHAQNGCVDSPENPTALLGLAGLMGATVTAWCSRRK